MICYIFKDWAPQKGTDLSNHKDIFADAIGKILRPLVRLALSRGLTLDSFTDITKRVFVDVATHEFHIEGKKQTKSRIAALTGIHRKEVTRVQKLPEGAMKEISRKRNRAARVFSAWLREPQFLDQKGDPLPLAFEGKNGFSDLVKRFSGDIPVRTIIDEFKRLDMITINEIDGKLSLNSHGYVPRGDEDEYLEILGVDTQELIDTIIFNMQDSEGYELYQMKSVFRNVPVEYMAPFRVLSTRMSRNLLEELDHWLAAHDRDMIPDILGTGRAKVGLGIYQIESISEDGSHD